MKKTLVALLMSASFLIPVPAHAEVVGKWETNTVNIYISPLVNASWKPDAVVNAWNQGSPVTLVRVYEPCTKCINVRREDSHPSYWAGVAYTHTWIYPSGVVSLTHCDLIVYKSALRKTRTQTLAHEIGHCLGLNHNTLRNSVMSTTSKLTVEKRSLPMPKDFAALTALYS